MECAKALSDKPAPRYALNLFEKAVAPHGLSVVTISIAQNRPFVHIDAFSLHERRLLDQLSHLSRSTRTPTDASPISTALERNPSVSRAIDIFCQLMQSLRHTVRHISFRKTQQATVYFSDPSPPSHTRLQNQPLPLLPPLPPNPISKHTPSHAHPVCPKSTVATNTRRTILPPKKSHLQRARLPYTQPLPQTQPLSTSPHTHPHRHAAGSAAAVKGGRVSKIRDRACRNCGTSVTRQWLKGPEDWLCHRCGQYWRKNKRARPSEFWRRPVHTRAARHFHAHMHVIGHGGRGLEKGVVEDSDVSSEDSGGRTRSVSV